MATIISIEGNIGVGKSTIVDLLKSKYNKEENQSIIFLQEPVQQWETIMDESGVSILERFYKDQKSWSFAFQIMAYISRLSILKDAVKKNPNSIIITERSLFTDKNVFAKMLYDDGMINKIEYQIYLRWFNDFIEEVPITGYIYLNADPKICSERISKRSRKGESIPLQYLEKCHKYHEDWLLNSDISKDMFINLDCSTDSDELPKIKRTWLNQIDLFMKKIESSNNSKKESIFFPSGC